ncbi:MAG TPA: hypothetical protein VH023_16140 [Rhodopila sp.]|jgi:hypothetical protein|nr:hypothetical protein [Rhodopila sp.]
MNAHFRFAAIVMTIALPLSASAQTQQSREAGACREPFRDKFAEANTTHDGCLTSQQAAAGGLNGIVRQFARIDTAKHGCVTLAEIRTYRQALNAQRRAAGRQNPGSRTADACHGGASN